MHRATFQYFRSCLSEGISCEALIADVLKNIDAQDARLGLFEYVARQEALSAARALDKAPNLRNELPLYGMPFAVKDIINVAQMPKKYVRPQLAMWRNQMRPWSENSEALEQS